MLHIYKTPKRFVIHRSNPPTCIKGSAIQIPTGHIVEAVDGLREFGELGGVTFCSCFEPADEEERQDVEVLALAALDVLDPPHVRRARSIAKGAPRVTKAEFCKLLGKGKGTLSELMKTADFPPSVPSGNAHVWLKSDVERYIARKIIADYEAFERKRATGKHRPQNQHDKRKAGRSKA